MDIFVNVIVQVHILDRYILVNAVVHRAI